MRQINVMCAKNLKLALLAVTTLLLSSCAQRIAQPQLVRVATLPDNQACNHRFTGAQRSLEPKFTEKVTTSIVGGSSVDTLMRSLERTAYEGQGNTRWTLTWSFDSRVAGFRCRIENVETSVEVDYLLPEWSEQLDVENPALSNQWNLYSNALRAHHCKHGKTGIDASLEVKSRLQRLVPFSSCEVLKQEADALAKSVISVYKLVESDFTPPKILNFLPR